MNLDWSLLTPEYILAGWAGMLVLVSLFWGGFRKDWLPYLAAAGALAGTLSSLAWINFDTNFAGIIEINNYTAFFRIFFGLIALFAILASARFVKDRLRHPGEYYALILLATLGANSMVAATELLTAYISLELLSFSLYVLTSFAKFDRRSNEGGLKYILLGAFSSAILLFGISLIYGVTNTTQYSGISQVVAGDISNIDTSLFLGLALILSGLSFKVAAVPFHMWTPDAYEGAPFPVTAFISALSKAAGFALFLKLFSQAFLPIVDDWRLFIAALATITMILGNLVAIQQKNIKRLFAYSSIGQVGFLMVGMASLSATNTDAASAILLHLVGYVISTLAAFVVAIVYFNLTGKQKVSDYAGLAERAPFLALVMSIALFSLAGMPLFAGFATKFILFQTAANEGLLWLAAVAVVMSFISLYYYLVVIKHMYIGKASESTRLSVSWIEYAVIGSLAVGVLFVGIYPQALFNAVEASTQFLYTASNAVSVIAINR